MNQDQELINRKGDRDRANYLQLIGDLSQKPLETYKNPKHQRGDHPHRSRSFFSDADKNNSHTQIETSPVRKNLIQNPN